MIRENLASLGDSGFLVIRGSQVIYQQRPQTHFFNCPKYVASQAVLNEALTDSLDGRQLSKLPTAQKRFSRAVVDHPRDADLCELKLRHGDLIIAYVRSNPPAVECARLTPFTD